MNWRGKWLGVWARVGVTATWLVSCDEGATGVAPPNDSSGASAGTEVTVSGTPRDPSTSSDVPGALASGATSETADTATSDATQVGVETTPSGASSDRASSGAGSESDDSTTCPKAPPLPQGADGAIAIPFTVVSGAEPLKLNTETLTAEGIPYQISLLGLFLSRPRFESAGGELVDAAFVDEQGASVPYGVYYYLSSSPSRVWNLAAPNGEYVALHVELGVPAECQQKIGEEPLSPSSQMYWPWGATFMALRMEGMVRESDAGADQFLYHLGPLPGAPLNKTSIRVAGEWSVGPEVTSETALELDLAHVLAPRPVDEPIAGHPLFAEWAITNLVDTAFTAAR